METPRHPRPRKPRRDTGAIRWTERDLAALTWIGEQYAVHLAQLAILLGRRAGAPTKAVGRLGLETARKLVERWRRAGLVERAVLVLGQPAWVWLTRRGLEQVGLDFRFWEPKAEGLAHLAAINEARLWVEQRHPEARWRSERQLRREQPVTRSQENLAHRPDAEVVLGPQTVAVEVERSAKTPQRMPAILYDLAARYASIWYFCPPAMKPNLARAFEQLEEAARQKCFLVPLVALEGKRPDGQPGA